MLADIKKGYNHDPNKTYKASNQFYDLIYIYIIVYTKNNYV